MPGSVKLQAELVDDGGVGGDVGADFPIDAAGQLGEVLVLGGAATPARLAFFVFVSAATLVTYFKISTDKPHD